VAAAYGLSRWRSPLRDFIDSVLTLPLVLPPTVLGYYLLVLFGRRGTFGAWLESMGINWSSPGRARYWPPPWWPFRWCSKRRAPASSVDHQLENAARVLGVSRPACSFASACRWLRGITAGVLLALPAPWANSAPP
jgi:molybdate transport system permease protein